MNGEAVRHEATIRYTFRNVLATPRGFYTSAGPFQTGGSYSLSGLITAKIPVYETGFYSPPTIGRRFFAHWMLDGLAHTLLRLPDEALYFGTPQNWPHACEYLDILGLDRIKSPFVYFKEMTYCEDIGQNAGRHARFAEMRRRLFAKIGAETHRGVFIKRGETGVRRLLDNEKILKNSLSHAVTAFAVLPMISMLSLPQQLAPASLYRWRAATGPTHTTPPAGAPDT